MSGTNSNNRPGSNGASMELLMMLKSELSEAKEEHNAAKAKQKEARRVLLAAQQDSQQADEEVNAAYQRVQKCSTSVSTAIESMTR